MSITLSIPDRQAELIYFLLLEAVINGRTDPSFDEWFAANFKPKAAQAFGRLHLGAPLPEDWEASHYTPPSPEEELMQRQVDALKQMVEDVKAIGEEFRKSRQKPDSEYPQAGEGLTAQS